MGRTALIALALAASCGGPHAKDYEVQSDFAAGSGAPPAPGFDNAVLTAPISDDRAHLKGISLQSATLRTVDGGDLSFVQSLEVRAGGGPAHFVAASLATAPAAGVGDVELALLPGGDLTALLKSGGRLDAIFTYASPATPHVLELKLKLHGVAIGSVVEDDPDTFFLGGTLDPNPQPDTTDTGPPPPDDDPGDPGDCCDLRGQKKPVGKNATGPKR